MLRSDVFKQCNQQWQETVGARHFKRSTSKNPATRSAPTFNVSPPNKDPLSRG